MVDVKDPWAFLDKTDLEEFNLDCIRPLTVNLNSMASVSLSIPSNKVEYEKILNLFEEVNSFVDSKTNFFSPLLDKLAYILVEYSHLS